MAFWTTRSAARRSLTALAVFAGTLGAQATKCELPMQAHPKLLTAGLQFNGVFKPTAKPEDKAKALQIVMKTLTDDAASFPANMQPSRNFLLGQTLLVWLDQPGTTYSESRAKLGYTADPGGRIDVPAALDSAFEVIRVAKPECADSLKLYTNGLWGQLINKSVTFSNAQQSDSAELYARRSLLFDKKQYYAYNIMSNIALAKDDTTAMIEWFTKTIAVTSGVADTNAVKVRDNMLLNLGAIYTNGAASAEGAKKDSLTKAAVATYKRYLAYYPNDLTTKLRILRMSGATLDSAAASRFVDTVLANVNTVSDAQLTDAGSELTKNKLYSSGLRLFEEALKKNPFSRDGLYNSAVALNNLERFDAIAPLFVRLRDIDPNNTGIYTLARNIQSARKLVIQTAANKGVRPRAGQQIMLNPAQQAKIKIYNDSLVYFTTLIQNMNPTVDVRSFSPAPDGAKFGAVVQVPPDKPAAAYGVVVDFLNRDGAVVATQTIRTKQIAPGGFETINAEGKGSGIVAFRYKVAK
jgi:tetratricopeptide (TPR) repeat protein